MTLAIKYRPINFAQIVGQSVAVNIAIASLSQSPLHTTYLLVGASGSGKTTLARIMARALNCQERDRGNVEPCNQCDSCIAHLHHRHLDINEIDGADRNGVDDVREIIEQCQLNTVTSKYRVYIIDEAHQMSKAAQNALLKLLEEPPRNTIFFLCTTEENKLLETIRSRARILRFTTVSPNLVIGYLSSIARAENIPLTEEEAHKIYDYNKGSIRKCLQTLGTISPSVTVTDLCPKIALEAIQQLFLAFEGKDFLTINNIVRDVVEQGFYPKQLLTDSIELAIEIMAMADTNPELIFNLNRVLEVIIPATNRLGSSTNTAVDCRLALYEATTVWRSNAVDNTKPQMSEQNNNKYNYQPVSTPQPQVPTTIAPTQVNPQVQYQITPQIPQPLAFQTSHQSNHISGQFI